MQFAPMRLARYLTLSFWFFAACDSSSNSPGPIVDGGGNDAAIPAGECQPDPAVIGERRLCVNDALCPCGSHCQLGRCEADCSTDADCDEGRCDSYGRCRGAAETALVPVPAPTSLGGTIRLDEPSVVVDAEGEGRLHFRISGPAPRVRLTGLGGAEIACTPGTWATECELENVAGGLLELVVAARLGPSADPATIAGVRLWTATDHTSATVVRPEQLPASSAGLVVTAGKPGVLPMAAPPRRSKVPGRYAGKGRVVQTGIDGALGGPAQDLDLPFEAELFGNDDGSGISTIRIVDRYGVLTSAGELVGTFALAHDDTNGGWSGSAHFPVHPYFESSLSGQPYKALAAIEAQVFVSEQIPSLTVDLTERIQGLGVPLTTRFLLTLPRVGDGSGTSAPPYPGDATLGYDEAVLAGTPTPWESTVASAFPAYDSLTAAEKRAHAGWILGEPVQLGACYDPKPEEARNLLLGAWPDPAGDGFSSDPQSWADHPTLIRRLWYSLVWRSGPPPLAVRFRDGAVTTGTPPPANEIPCGGRFNSGVLEGATGSNFLSTGQIEFDVCNELEERLGCRVELRASSNFTMTRWADLDLPDGPSAIRTVEARITLNYAGGAQRRYCVLPEKPPACAPAMACAEVSNGSTQASVTTSGFGEVLGAASGETSCATGTRSAAVTIDHAADLGTEEARASDAYASCPAELAALREAPPDLDGSLHGAALSKLFHDGTCLDSARLIASAALGLVGTDGGEGTTSELARTYGAHLLARWLRAHAFIASETLERDAMRAVFDGTAGRETPDAADALAASLAGWDLVLHPRFARALSTSDGPELTAPDYRTRVGSFRSSELAGKDPTSAIAAVMLDTLAQQGRLLSSAMEAAARIGDRDVSVELRSVLPRVVLAQALSSGLAARASAVDSRYAWAPSQQRASRAVSLALDHALGVAAIAESGRNPLGIDDDDLPLYFLDDATGPGGRFAAVSDFLLGSGPADPAWASTLVSQAGAALDAARDRYADQQDREYLVARIGAERKKWIADIEWSYDDRLRDFCGPVDGLASKSAFDAASCATNPDNTCVTRNPLELWSNRDLAGRLVASQAIKSNWGNSEYGLRNRALDALVARCLHQEVDTNVFASYTAWLDANVSWQQCHGQADTNSRCIVCAGESYPEPIVPLDLEVLRPTFGTDHVGQIASSVGGRAHPPAPITPMETPGCFRGSIGEAYLDVATATRTIQRARAAYAEHEEAYGIAMETCNLMVRAEDERYRLREELRTYTEPLRVGMAVANSIAAAAGAVQSCAGTRASQTDNALNADVAPTLTNQIPNPVATITNCVAGFVGAAAQIANTGLSAAVEMAQRKHDAALAHVEAQLEVDTCRNEARRELVGLRTAAIDIEQAVFDQGRANARVSELIASAQRIQREGFDYLAEIRAAAIEPPSGARWADAQVLDYVRRFRLARRATYLAVRAVEHEFQGTLAERADVLRAETPADLEAVLSDLWATAGTRSVVGNRPSDLHVVLSLRDDVLRLQDRSAYGANLRQSDKSAAFRELLASQDYAAYGVDGRYRGQRIPFTLAPFGAGPTDAGTVPIYGTRDCAERLWSVNASLLGADPFEGSETTFVRIELEKQNSFFSQWCGAAPAGEAFQTASVRPSRNLFREPGVGETVGAAEFGTELPLRQFTSARIQAFFGVDRATLEEPSYANGETSELAARGLYGDYALFIPAELIARQATSGGYTPGVVLDRVDDILLRLDYVSVARP